jgi:hypothetical protein
MKYYFTSPITHDKSGTGMVNGLDTCRARRGPTDSPSGALSTGSKMSGFATAQELREKVISFQMHVVCR